MTEKFNRETNKEVNKEKRDNSEITTIKLYKKTKDRLEKLRNYKRESYDEIIQKMLDILNTLRVEPERARSKLVSIDKSKVTEKEGIY